MNVLSVRNRHPHRRIDANSLRRIVRDALHRLFTPRHYILSVQIVGSPAITRLNEQFLHHAGDTDVVTFDHNEIPNRAFWHADIVVCLDEASRQARRFHTTPSTEIVRYCVHGMLHLAGFEDNTASNRRRMKSVEDRALRLLLETHPLPVVTRPRSRTAERRLRGLRPKALSSRQPARPSRR